MLTRTYRASTGLRRCPVASAGGALVHLLPSSETWMLDDAGSASVQSTAMPEIFIREPKSTVRLPPPALGSGAQIVAPLPSTAASAYMPASSELAVAGRHRATLVVGARSGRRVAIDSDEPVPTSCMPSGASTGREPPPRDVTRVVVGPMSTSNVRPCQCRPDRVTPPESCGGNIGSRCTRSLRHRNPVSPYVKTWAKPPEPVVKS